jgi:hypothetical protein
MDGQTRRWVLEPHPDGTQPHDMGATRYSSLQEAMEAAQTTTSVIEGELWWRVSCRGGSDQHWQGWLDGRMADPYVEQMPEWTIVEE